MYLPKVTKESDKDNKIQTAAFVCITKLGETLLRL